MACTYSNLPSIVRGSSGKHGADYLRSGTGDAFRTSRDINYENDIDLDEVRRILSHFHYRDFQEAQELILSALQEVNEHFGWVSLEPRRS